MQEYSRTLQSSGLEDWGSGVETRLSICTTHAGKHLLSRTRNSSLPCTAIAFKALLPSPLSFHSIQKPFSSVMKPLRFLCPALQPSKGPAIQSIPQHVRTSYIAFAKRSLSSTCSRSTTSQFHRSDFANQPFTGSYEPGQPTTGPLAGASIYGAPRLTPKMLKQHLDQFVVGQDRAKKIMSVAVFNHYQRIQELQRREEEEEELIAQRDRRERHPLESRPAISLPAYQRLLTSL